MILIRSKLFHYSIEGLFFIKQNNTGIYSTEFQCGYVTFIIYISDGLCNKCTGTYLKSESSFREERKRSFH